VILVSFGIRSKVLEQDTLSLARARGLELPTRPLISLIMPIHNEEKYLPESLATLKKIENQFFEFTFILDRCTDNSEKLVTHWFPNAKILKKDSAKWKNSYAENLQLGFEASKGNIICIQDADATAPTNLEPLLSKLHGDVASVAPTLLTSKDVSFLNRLYYLWEKTRRFAPLGEEPRGAFRFIRRECLEQVGGFKDVISPDTQLDIGLRQAGYRSIVVRGIVYYHLREFSLGKAIRSQIQAGRMRRQLNMPFWRVVGHAVFRLRPFVVYGYLFKNKKDKPK
jgi:glycosyltransferase involved in cell wall biosynthesis